LIFFCLGVRGLDVLFVQWNEKGIFEASKPLHQTYKKLGASVHSEVCFCPVAYLWHVNANFQVSFHFLNAPNARDLYIGYTKFKIM
jgi:hypothetical protein